MDTQTLNYFNDMTLTTHFASPERSEDKELAIEIDMVSQNTIVTGLLHAVSGVLAVVNEHRQVIALNDTFVKMLGIKDPKSILGLRPGEILQCCYAGDGPSGCGTSEYCSSCGAAVAMVSSLEDDKPMEKLCAITAQKGENEIDISLSVSSHPLKVNGKRFLLLFIRDITKQQQLAALERSFFHDVSNMLSMLVGSSEMLIEDCPSPLSETVYKATTLLQKEIAIQRLLSFGKVESYTALWHQTTPAEILLDLQRFFAHHPVAARKKLSVDLHHGEILFNTDLSLIHRVLSNMITNALEASDESDEVKIWLNIDRSNITFHVWNRLAIDQSIQNRIFQRNYSTKAQEGRGIGTFSMKLLGEKILGGKVNFSTSKEDGTLFTLAIPRDENNKAR